MNLMLIQPSRYIVVVRHGKDDPRTGFLSDLGEDQADRLAQNIRRFLQDRPTTIITSTANRAVETAEIIAYNLAIKVLADECLFSESPCDIAQLKKNDTLVNRYYYSHPDMNVIIVTHLEVTKQFPNFYAQSFRAKTIFPEIALPNASGWVIDHANATIGSISSSRAYNPNIVADRIRWQARCNQR